MDDDPTSFRNPDNGLLTRVVGWAQHPLDGSADVVGWFLFTGLIIVSAVIWTRILRLITEVA